MISILPEHYLVIGILIIFSFFSLNSLSIKYNFPSLTVGNVVSIAILILNFFFLTTIDLVFEDIYFNFFFVKNIVQSFMHLFVSIILLCLLPIIYVYNKNNKINTFEFYNLSIIAFFSLILLISSREFMSFFFLLEIQGISFYILASYNRSAKYSIESGIKYFILSSFSSILILLGFSILYSITGLMDFNDIYYYFSTTDSMSYIHYFSFILVLSGFFFKLYHFPFHFWIADIYEGSPLSSVSVFSTLPLLNIFYSLFIVLFYCYSTIVSDIKQLLFALVALTMLAGTLFALYQKNIKRILAYSSVTNIGYICSALLNDNIQGFMNGMLFVCIYIINLLSFFIFFMSLYDFSTKSNITNVNALKGFYQTHPQFATLLSLNLFSIAGLPPFAAFFSKLFLITSLFNESYFYIVFVIIVVTFIGSYIYLRIVKLMMYNDVTTWFYIKPLSYSMAFSLSLLLLFQLYFSFYTSSFASFLYNISLAIV